MKLILIRSPQLLFYYPRKVGKGGLSFFLSSFILTF